MHPVQFVGTYNAHIVAIANIAIALGTIILAFGIPWSLVSNRRAVRDTFYSTLDSTYFEIQKLIIEHPHLSQPNAAKTHEQKVQYDAFAFLTWNFIESISDYSERDPVLRATWDCILVYEVNLHKEWFQNPANRKKFKEKFQTMVKARHLRSDAIS